MALVSLALPIFAITLFISAFLLFLVQPMIGRMILPGLGGTPQVWNTCMVFFQTALLAGYAYTHTVSTRLKLKTQLLVHGILLFVPIALLFGLGSFKFRIEQWVPPSGGNPIFATLWLLTIVVGIPFFVVSTSAPLLQKWFSATGHPSSKDPYFLYGASNLGSMLSLLMYPYVIEPYFKLSEQSYTWTVGYVLLVIMYFVCVATVMMAPPEALQETKGKKTDTDKESGEEKKEKKKEPKETGITAKKPASAGLSSRIRKGAKSKPKSIKRKTEDSSLPSVTYSTDIRSDAVTPWRRLRWVALAAAPSSFMLGITTYISTDVSAIPLFWVIPLALYLLTFILVFSRWPVTWIGQPHTIMVIAQPFMVLCLIWLLLTHQVSPIYRSVTFSILAFFLTTLVCHGELARDRPTTKHLTQFYLWMSVGGMLGGVFNALFAPVIFTGLTELPMAIALGCVLRPLTNRLAIVEKPILVASLAILGAITGYLIALPGFGGIPGPILWGVIGAALGGLAAVLFESDARSNGWAEDLVLGISPALGDYLDKKGKELRENQDPEKKDDEEGEKETKKKTKRKTPPDYYLLNNILDVALPVLVILIMILCFFFRTSIHSAAVSFGKNVLGVTSLGLFAYGAVQLFQFGIPLVCAYLFSFRPVRFGLLIAGIFLVAMNYERISEQAEVLYRGRSYFGLLRVLQKKGDPLAEYEVEQLLREYMPRYGYSPVDREEFQKKYGIFPKVEPPYHYLMHGTTHHGLNYQSPKPLRRLATTYYHRKGPIGVIYERFNWFPGTPNTYWADNRMPASLVGMGMPTSLAGVGSGLPANLLVDMWSEPPVATIGLGTGTMASYGRPLHHVTFYEIDNQIRSFSLPPEGKEPYFNYLQDSIKRGTQLEVIMGDARQSMRKRVEREREEKRKAEGYPAGSFYQHRDGYYHAMVVDAFSSDAIPVHLITKEAIIQYFDKLAPGGVLLLHTSNRHVDLPKPIMDIIQDINQDAARELDKNPDAKPLELEYRVVNCLGERHPVFYKKEETGQIGQKNHGSFERGHFQSEYVMVARAVRRKDKKRVAKGWADRLKLVLKNLDIQLEKNDINTYEKKALEQHLKLALGMGEVKENEDGTTRVLNASYLPNKSSSTDIDNYNRRILPHHWQIWDVPTPPGRPPWTDDYQNLLSVFRWGFHF